MLELKQHKNDIDKLCENSRVKSLFIFGSAITDRYNASSDIDLIVDINETDPFKYTDYYYNLKFGLEALLKRQIDLLEARAIQNKYFKR